MRAGAAERNARPQCNYQGCAEPLDHSLSCWRVKMACPNNQGTSRHVSCRRIPQCGRPRHCAACGDLRQEEEPIHPNGPASKQLKFGAAHGTGRIGVSFHLTRRPGQSPRVSARPAAKARARARHGRWGWLRGAARRRGRTSGKNLLRNFPSNSPEYRAKNPKTTQTDRPVYHPSWDKA